MLYFKLDQIMDKKNLTINKVSSETKISRPALTAMYNNDSRGAQFDTLEKLIEYLEVSLDDLIGEKINQNVFIFKPTKLKEDLLKAENDTIDARDDNFVNVKPSETLPYEAVLMENGEVKKKFEFAVHPLVDTSSTNLIKKEKTINSILIVFYRTDDNGNNIAVNDINVFLGNLNTEAVISLAENIFKSWFSIFSFLTKENESIFSNYLILDIGLIGKKTKIPLIARIDNTSNELKLDFDILRKESKIKGNNTYSSNLEFKEISGDIMIPE